MKHFAVLALLLGGVGEAQAQQQHRAPLDTLIRFAVAERTWSWPFFSGHVAIGCGSNVVIGMTTAPDSAALDRESWCAGAQVEMRHSTLTLRGARGQVRVRVSRPALVQDSSATTRRPDQ